MAATTSAPSNRATRVAKWRTIPAGTDPQRRTRLAGLALGVLGHVDDPRVQAFNGLVDDMAIYHKSLTGEQVQAHYQAGRA